MRIPDSNEFRTLDSLSTGEGDMHDEEALEPSEQSWMRPPELASADALEEADKRSPSSLRRTHHFATIVLRIR